MQLDLYGQCRGRHRGWCVRGVPPGEVELVDARPEPYELEQAAELCAQLLRADGWTQVIVSPVMENE